MEHIEYPKWKYRGKEAVLVHTEQEESALGEGWADAPTEAQEAAEAIDPRDAEIEALKAQLAEAKAAKPRKRQPDDEAT